MTGLTVVLALPEQIKNCSVVDVRKRFEFNLLQIIEETFVFTADEDYVTARMLALTGMERMFFWAAAQALEKYFKAILLQQGTSCKKENHSITSLINKYPTMFKFLNKVDCKPSNAFLEKTNADWKGYWSIESIEDFFSHIDKYGCVDNRYNQVGKEYDVSMLIILDRVVFAIQEYILRSVDIKIQAEKMDKNISCFFEKNNEVFSENDPPIPKFSNTVIHLERALKDCYGHSALYEQWLKDNIKINDRNIAFLKSL